MADYANILCAGFFTMTLCALIYAHFSKFDLCVRVPDGYCCVLFCSLLSLNEITLI